MAVLRKIEGEIDSNGNLSTTTLRYIEHGREIYKILLKQKPQVSIKFVVYLIENYENIMADLILIRKSESKNKLYFRKDFVLIIKNSIQL